ncbi:MAG: helix-turn-helix domain-containing protein [Nitrososphaerota archaeon]|nr:helix-turn-helix domain-containing protein [Nitrososphaerota archaeon]
MTQSQVIDDLVSFGLSPLQAEAYVALTRSGRGTPSSIAQTIGISASDVRRVLHSLRRLGLVEVELGRSDYFLAVACKKALRTLLDAKETELQTLKGQSEPLARLLEDSKRRRGAKDEESFFRLVSGSLVFNRWADAIRRAKARVIKVVPAYTLSTHFRELSDAESSAARRVNVTIVSEITEQNLKIAEQYYRKVPFLHADGLTPSFRYLIIDQSEVFMGGTPPTESIEDHLVIWTNNRVFVDACSTHFESIMRVALDGAKRMEALRRVS